LVIASTTRSTSTSSLTAISILILGRKSIDVLGAAVQLGVALLAAEALDLGDGDALNADLEVRLERLADVVELERLDDVAGDRARVSS
jgi:hypothetical protein